MNIKNWVVRFFGFKTVVHNGSGNSSFTLDIDAQLIWSIFIGFIFFGIFYFFLDMQNKEMFIKNFKTSSIWLIAQIFTFSSALIAFLICFTFGTKNQNQRFVFENKYLWIKPILYFFLGLLFISIGFMAGAVFLLFIS